MNGDREPPPRSDGPAGRSVPAMGLTLESPAALVAAFAGARDISLIAYTLREGTVREALVDAAHAGASVRVRLERDPLDDAAGTLHRANAESVSVLRAAGAVASETAAGEPTLHLKAAVVDGVVWLSDRNWAGAGPERILRDTDADDVAAITAAVAGGPGADGHLGTTKAGALRLEVDVIERAGTAPLAVESESFGDGPIYNALLHRAQAAEATRLVVAGRELSETAGGREERRLRRLAALGVDVRVGDPARGDLDEKMAIAAGDAWLGSANATYARGAYGQQRDWGLATRAPAIGAALTAAFDRNWQSARPLADALAAR